MANVSPPYDCIQKPPEWVSWRILDPKYPNYFIRVPKEPAQKTCDQMIRVIIGLGIVDRGKFQEIETDGKSALVFRLDIPGSGKPLVSEYKLKWERLPLNTKTKAAINAVGGVIVGASAHYFISRKQKNSNDKIDEEIKNGSEECKMKDNKVNEWKIDINRENAAEYVTFVEKYYDKANGNFQIFGEQNITQEYDSNLGTVEKILIKYDQSDIETSIKNIQYKYLTTSNDYEWFFQRASTRTGVEGGFNTGHIGKMFGTGAVQGEQLGQTVLCADKTRKPYNLDNQALRDIKNNNTHNVDKLVSSTCIGVILGARLIGKDGSKFEMTPIVHENLRTNHLLCYALDLGHKRNPKYQIFNDNPPTNAKRIHAFAQKLLVHQYYLAMAAAAEFTPKDKKTGIVLTMLGGGSFGNNPEWIANAIPSAYTRFLTNYPNTKMKIIVVYMFPSIAKFKELATQATTTLENFVSTQ